MTEDISVKLLVLFLFTLTILSPPVQSFFDEAQHVEIGKYFEDTQDTSVLNEIFNTPSQKESQLKTIKLE